MTTTPDAADDELAEILAEHLARNEAQAAELATQLASLGDLRDPNNDDEHDPDGATVSAEWSRLAGLQYENRAEHTEIRDAIARLERGEYGVCRSCGTPIPPARLRVRPMATTCVACAD